MLTEERPDLSKLIIQTSEEEGSGLLMRDAKTDKCSSGQEKKQHIMDAIHLEGVVITASFPQVTAELPSPGESAG